MGRKPIFVYDDTCEERSKAMANVLKILRNGSTIEATNASRRDVARGSGANYIWEPFIDENGNGCCTNVLTGETYLDWTKEELEDV